MKIIFIIPYPSQKAPSQRFRFEQYIDFIKLKGWDYRLAPFIDNKTWSILYKPGHFVQKAIGVLKGFLNRFLLLFEVPRYDFIFIHREATPIGPPWFEWIVAKILRKKIVYDYDDAIWMADTAGNNKIVSGIKWYKKVKSIVKWSYKISAGNQYLQNYALQHNPAVLINPTTIDTENLHNQFKEQLTERVVIGWTGTHTTMRHLEIVAPVIKRLEEQYDFDFCVISNARPDLNLKSLVYRPWNKETEIVDLLSFNIGIMPLVDDPWANGKCAFKALQYMALGIPAVVSPVGMNKEVVDNTINGFISNSEDEWYHALETLVKNTSLRVNMGKAAREKIIQKYSVVSNKELFLSLFS